MKIGILGAGQLAQMLSLSGQALGHEIHILAKSPTEPASTTTPYVQIGNPENPEDLSQFCEELDYITFESEFYQSAKLLEGLKDFKGECFPPLSALEKLQDRRNQKDFLVKNKIPTSPHLEVSDLSDLKTAFEKFPKGFVLKKRTGGYDGNGTFYAKGPKDFQRLSEVVRTNPQGFIAEAFIHFDREIAVMAFRNRKGKVQFFPWVQSEQKDSRCDLVTGPIHHKSFRDFEKKMSRALAKIDYVGAIGIELFQSQSQLFVNELAPRVHNTGHFSQEALLWSQFDLHLIAGTESSFPENLLLAPCFAMANLIGKTASPAQSFLPKFSKLHWYQKSESRPGRKMGHLNLVGKSLASITKKIRADQRSFKA